MNSVYCLNLNFCGNTFIYLCTVHVQLFSIMNVYQIQTSYRQAKMCTLATLVRLLMSQLEYMQDRVDIRINRWIPDSTSFTTFCTHCHKNQDYVFSCIHI